MGVETLPPDKLISIHALRVEGDFPLPAFYRFHKISIHALRVEGDSNHSIMRSINSPFLSTPSGWRATREERQA